MLFWIFVTLIVALVVLGVVVLLKRNKKPSKPLPVPPHIAVVLPSVPRSTMQIHGIEQRNTHQHGTALAPAATHILRKDTVPIYKSRPNPSTPVSLHVAHLGAVEPEYIAPARVIDSGPDLLTTIVVAEAVSSMFDDSNSCDSSSSISDTSSSSCDTSSFDSGFGGGSDGGGSTGDF